MIICDECGKKLKIIEEYKHPILGKKNFLCSKCFDQVSENVQSWKNFILSHSFIIESSNNITKFDWKNIAIKFTQANNRYQYNFNHKNNERLHDSKLRILFKKLSKKGQIIRCSFN